MERGGSTARDLEDHVPSAVSGGVRCFMRIVPENTPGSGQSPVCRGNSCSRRPASPLSDVGGRVDPHPLPSRLGRLQAGRTHLQNIHRVAHLGEER